MADLTPKSPAHGLTPVMLAGVHLTEAPMTAIWSIAPYRGQTEALSAALQQAHGMRFPAPAACPKPARPPSHGRGLIRHF